MNSNTKRKKTNANRPIRAKITVDKNVVCKFQIDGVYANARFMHAASSIVGCTVDIKTKTGDTYQGVFQAFSHLCEIVLGVAHKLDELQNKIPTKDGVVDALIIPLKDVVNLSATNIDLDYATKDNFSTDTAISKYNGQILERELEPWDENAGEVEDVSTLDVDNENGWDVNDMFRTNEQQYGVQSTYDNTLSGYTTPLERKNTDEYKKAEAKATKIASEIESSPNYLARIAVENGDEEEKFSAVVRPDNMGNTTTFHRYVPPAKRKSAQSGKLPRISPTQQNSSNNTPPGMKPHSLPQGHGPPHNPHGPAHGPRMQQQHGQPPGAHTPQTHYGPPQQPSSMGGVPTIPHHQPPPQSHQAPPIPQQQLPSITKMPPPTPNTEMMDVKMNGEKEEKKAILNVETNDQVKKVSSVTEPLHQPHLSSKLDRKNLNSKPEREEEIAEMKQFSSFMINKLQESDNDCSKADVIDTKEKNESEADKVANVLKKSTLNPNAKEFVLNPNAKAFTPRSPSTQTPTPPRPHTPSTNVMAQQMSIMPTQPVFAVQQPYMMQAPVSVSLNSPFNQAATMQQAPRMRKAMAPNMHQQRHEFSQVAAATGQPLLAPASIPGHPHHITVQYPPHQGLMTNHGQAPLPYPHLYSLVHRMVGPQPISMVSTSHGASYGDSQHQIFVSPHQTGPLNPNMGGPNPHHPANQMQTGPPHSNPQTPQGPQMPGQGQGGGVHPNPSPVHQPPPTHGGPPPTQTPPSTVGGSQQTMVYQQAPHPSQLGQPPSLQPSPHTPNSPQTMHPGAAGQGGPLSHNPHMQHHNAHASGSSHGGPHMGQAAHQHPGAGAGGPGGYAGPQGQPGLVLIQPGHGHPPGGPTFQGQMHAAGPTVLMPHSSMMPATSGAATMSTHPQLYIPHHVVQECHNYVKICRNCALISGNAIEFEIKHRNYNLLLKLSCSRTLMLSEQNSKTIG
uniref:LsmAD domain-containing protein n=1 Tax=Strigamia maritima TaxID=126957 RepID=T1J5D2_STRMM